MKLDALIYSSMVNKDEYRPIYSIPVDSRGYFLARSILVLSAISCMHQEILFKYIVENDPNMLIKIY